MHQLGSRQGSELTGAISQPRQPARSPCPRGGGRGRPWAPSVRVPRPLLSCSLARPEGPGEDGWVYTDRPSTAQLTVGKPLRLFIFLRKTVRPSRVWTSLHHHSPSFLIKATTHLEANPLAASSSISLAGFPQLWGECSFPGGSDDKESACRAGGLGSIPGSG